MAITFVLLEIVRLLAWAPAHEKAERLLLRSQDELVQVWKADGGAEADVPKVDWSKEMVLAAFMGARRTGGYEVKIERVVFGTEPGELYAIYKETVPGAGDATTQAITHPSHVVVVAKREVNKTVWLEASSAEAKQMLEAIQAGGK